MNMFNKFLNWFRNDSEKIVDHSEMFDQEKLKFICENYGEKTFVFDHFEFSFSSSYNLYWSENHKKFTYLKFVYIITGFIREKIYDHCNYTSGVWDNALKETLETIYQKAVERQQEKLKSQIERKNQIEQLFKKEI